MERSGKWIIGLVAFDDSELPPQVLKERIGINDDEQVAAFMRGGELLDVLKTDDETIAEGYRAQIEKQCLR